MRGSCLWMLVVLAVAFRVVSAAPPRWSDLSSEHRQAIQSHYDDLIMLPNGLIVDLWPLREAQRVQKRNTYTTYYTRSVVRGGARFRERVPSAPALRDSREVRAWHIPHADLPFKIDQIPVPFSPAGACTFDAYLDHERPYAVYGRPATFAEFMPSRSDYGLDPSQASPVAADRYPRRVRPTLCKWRDAQTLQPANDTVAFRSWINGKAWSLIWFEDVREVLRSATHIADDQFRIEDRTCEVPRSFRGGGYLWVANLYDPACPAVLLRESDLQPSREDVVAAIVEGRCTIETWEVVTRAGADILERDLIIDADTLASSVQAPPPAAPRAP